MSAEMLENRGNEEVFLFTTMRTGQPDKGNEPT
jgi:hypothetical protein